MITITGWLRYDFGEVLLTFENPDSNTLDNAVIVASGDVYEEGDKRTYLKAITTIDESFWNHFTEDELETLVSDECDISFEIFMLEGDIRTLVKNNKIFTQESDPEDNEDEIQNNEQIVSKQKTETVYSSIASLI